ncbi:MAG: hypothetical protein R3344_10025, partial [Acidobacteriota bacterium]|nr:hypothetical protein [Acidobacteriota bacterium]
MHCRRARKAMLEQRLGLLSERAESRWRAHVASCAACAAETKMDDVLDRELSRLARPSPVRVDVARRVLAETGAAGAVDRRAVLPSQLAW